MILSRVLKSQWIILCAKTIMKLLSQNLFKPRPREFVLMETSHTHLHNLQFFQLHMTQQIYEN